MCFVSARWVSGNQKNSKWSVPVRHSSSRSSTSSSRAGRSWARTRKAGTQAISISVTTPRAPRPTRIASKRSGRSRAEHSTMRPSASTTWAPVTKLDRLPKAAPVPWVPVASAPLIVWRSMSPRFARARPRSASMRLRSARRVPARTRTRAPRPAAPARARTPAPARAAGSFQMMPARPHIAVRSSITPSVAAIAVKECPRTHRLDGLAALGGLGDDRGHLGGRRRPFDAQRGARLVAGPVRPAGGAAAGRVHRLAHPSIVPREPPPDLHVWDTSTPPGAPWRAGRP